jgi:hypothetical protein
MIFQIIRMIKANQPLPSSPPPFQSIDKTMRTKEKNTLITRGNRKKGKPYDRITLVLGLSSLLAPYFLGRVNKKKRLVINHPIVMALSTWHNPLKSPFTTTATMH